MIHHPYSLDSGCWLFQPSGSWASNKASMGRNAMTRTQTPFDNFFLSSPASLCTSKTVFLLWEQNWQYVLRSNNFNLSLLTLPCLQRRNTQRGRSGTHPRENRSESVAPAIGVCTKSLQIAVGGIFEHKPVVVRWYPVRSTYLHAFSTPLRSCLEKTNSQNVGNTPAGKPKVVKKIRCDLPSAMPAGPDRPSNVRVVEIASPFSFSLSCSNLQIVSPKRKPPFCSSHDNRVG